MVGSVIHEYKVGPVIQDYNNLEATLSIPQYGFQKGFKEFKELGYKAILTELDRISSVRMLWTCCQQSQSPMTS